MIARCILILTLPLQSSGWRAGLRIGSLLPQRSLFRNRRACREPPRALSSDDASSNDAARLHVLPLSANFNLDTRHSSSEDDRSGNGATRRDFLSASTWVAVVAASRPAFAGVASKKGTQVLGEVEKSPNDERSYRALLLSNGLRVLLVSDKETKSAAAALDAHVGHFSDPEELPGLAHFCEHLLFLGTNKYPDENEFSAFLSSHGGFSNAFTATEDTCYYFEVSADYLEGALDRFSQFFVAPRFTASATDRELGAIDSENAKNLQNDGFRAYQLEKSRANPEHPYHKFGTGSRQTLGGGNGARAALLKFYDKYYSSNQMTLCIVGKQSLDELQRWSEDMFAAVPDKGIPAPSTAWAGTVPPFVPEEAPTEHDVVPVQDIRKLSLAWPLQFRDPAARLAFLLAKPDVYLGTLVGHEGSGSLLSYLKGRGWANTLACQLGTTTDDFCTFNIEVDLTADGLKNRRGVISALYGFLALVARTGMPDYVVRELELMSAVAWRFQEKAGAGGLVEALAGSMQAIAGPTRLRNYDESQVRALLAALTPATALVTVFAKDFSTSALEKERWYGTAYSAVPLAASVTQAWEQARPPPELTLPRPNPFIPEGEAGLRIKAQRRRKLRPGDRAVPPETVQADDRWLVKFKQDDVFAQPKGYAYYELITPEVYASPRSVALLKLFQLSLNDALNEYSYEAQVAGLSYSLDFTTKGARLVFGGLNAKMPSFICAVAAAMAAHVPSDPVKFARFKDATLRELTSFDRQQPYYHAVFNAAVATEEPRYPVEQVKAAVEEARLSDFGPFLETCFARCFGLSLLQGNVITAEVRPDYLGAVEKAFRFAPLPREDRPQRRAAVLPASPGAGAGAVLQRRSRNPDDDNSAVQVLFQIGDRGTEARVQCELLATMMQDAFYDSLRTKQALGYLVFSGLKRVEGVQYLFFVVQSSGADPNYCADRVAEFVEDFRATVVTMAPSKLASFVEGIADRKMEVDQRLAQEATRNWDEIVGGEFRFDRRIEEAAALRRVTPAALLVFWDRYMAAGAIERRVLTSQVFALQHDGARGKAPAGGRVVGGGDGGGSDLLGFRGGLDRYPVVPTQW